MNVQRGRLCDVCQKLGLSSTNTRNNDSTEYSLGRYYDVWRKTVEEPFCPFCSLVTAIASRSPSAFIQGITLSWRPESGFYMGFDSQNITFLNEDTASSPYGSAREIKPQIDFSLVKRWLHLCEVHHPKTCTPEASLIRTAENPAGVKVLRLIDTWHQCVVEAEPGFRYVALSYVWGGVDQLKLLRENVEKFTKKDGLPRFALSNTVNEAMDLVRAIGERYLWVDCLCLLQNDPADMKDGVSKMDLIYRGAILTIIAAHGSDANAGLPGVQYGGRAVNQTIVEVEPGVRMTITDGVYDALNASQHTSRAWTLQELVLSHRLLVFARNRVYFRCRQNCWSEDTIFDKFPLEVNKTLDSGSGIEFIEDNVPKPLHRLNSLLFRYSARSLTLQSDAINGFSGILRYLAIQMNSGVLEGIHTISFDIGLLFWDPFPNASKPGRRPEFPSWTWAGWHGNKFNYSNYLPNDQANRWLETMTYIVWYKRDPGTLELGLVWDPQSAIESSELAESDIGYRATPGNPYGRTQEAGQLSNPEPRDDNDIRDSIRLELKDCKYHLLHFWTQLVHFPRLDTPDPEKDWAKVYRILDSAGMVCGGVKLEDPSLLSDLDSGHEFILLSKVNRYEKFFNDSVTIDKPIYWIMLITWRGSEMIVAERRGMGFLFVDCLDHAVPPGKCWKEIVLA